MPGLVNVMTILQGNFKRDLKTLHHLVCAPTKTMSQRYATGLFNNLDYFKGKLDFFIYRYHHYCAGCFHSVMCSCIDLLFSSIECMLINNCLAHLSTVSFKSILHILGCFPSTEINFAKLLFASHKEKKNKNKKTKPSLLTNLHDAPVMSCQYFAEKR